MLKNDSNPDSQNKQQSTPFYHDDLMRWLTSGWMRDDNPVRAIRGDDDIPWSDAADEDDDDYPFWTPRHLRREVA